MRQCIPVVCYHEAPHAVVAKMLGMTLLEVTVSPPGPEQKGQTTVEPTGQTLPDVAFLLAGSTYEEIYCPEECTLEGFYRQAGDFSAVTSRLAADGANSAEQRKEVTDAAFDLAAEHLAAAVSCGTLDKVASLLHQRAALSDDDVTGILDEAGMEP